VAAAIKIPKTLAACADRLYKAQAERYELQTQAKALEAEEAALREHLIQNLPKSQATGIAGKLARVYVESKTVVKVTDWDALQDYILKNAKKNPGVWALLQRRPGEAAVKELWEAGKSVPGTEPLSVPVVRMNKL